MSNIYQNGNKLAITKGVIPTGQVVLSAEGEYDVRKYASAKVKIGGEPIEVTLPQNFPVVDKLYYHKVAAGYLISGQLSVSPYTGAGLWLYNEETGTVTQLLASPGTGSYLYSDTNNTYDIEGGCLISGSASGLYLYLDETKQVTNLNASGSYFSKTQFKHKVILTSRSGGSYTYSFDTQTMTLTTLASTTTLGVIGELSDTKCFVGGSATGVYIYDIADNSFTQIISSGNYYSYLVDAGDTILIGGGVNAVDFWEYDKLTGTVTSILSQVALKMRPFKYGNKLYLLAYSGGLYSYDCLTRTLTLLYSSSNMYFYSFQTSSAIFFGIDSHCLRLSGDTVIDLGSCSIDNSVGSTAIELNGLVIFGTGSSTSQKRSYYVDLANNTLGFTVNSYGAYNKAVPVSATQCLLISLKPNTSSDYGRGIYLFDTYTKTSTKLLGQGMFTDMYVSGNKVIIEGDVSYEFDITSGTLKLASLKVK